MNDIYQEVFELTGLYYKRTDGGAEYLCREHIKFDEHHYIGDIATAVLRLDGGLELTGRK